MRTCDIDMSGKLWVFSPSTHKTAHHGHERAVYFGPKAQAVVEQWLRPNVHEFLFNLARRSPRAGQNVLLHRKNATKLRQRSWEQLAAAAGPKATRPLHGRQLSAGYRDRMRGGVWDASRPSRTTDREAEAGAGSAKMRKSGAKRGRRGTPHVWSPNQLRHDRRHLPRKQFGAEAAQVILGHRNLDVTEIYAEKNVEAAMKIMAKVDKLFELGTAG